MMPSNRLIKTPFTPGQLLERLQTLYPNCALDLDGGRVMRRQRLHWLLAGLATVLSAGFAAGLLLVILDIAAPPTQWVITATLWFFGGVGAIGWLIVAVRRPLVAIPRIRVLREGRELWVYWSSVEPLTLTEVVEFERLKAALAPRRRH